MWQVTHSLNCRGSYRRIGVHELYVREKFGQIGATWYVDGQRGGNAGNERSAQAHCEEACRRMDRTHTAALAASA
jgi:hypothetical protein